MRVIAGRFGGRRIEAPHGTRTRPTGERVREALFSMLGALDGAIVLDLYAGSGALGIEALSRGAGRAVFVERDRAALDALRGNLAALVLSLPLAEVRPGDALAALSRSAENGERYDVVFLDPPYALAPTLAQRLPQPLSAVLSGGARVVVEADRRSPLQLPLTPLRERRYGDTTMTIYAADQA